MTNEYQIYILSDAVGDTAEQVARATAEQFPDKEYELKKYPYIETTSKIDQIIEEALKTSTIIVFTMVDAEIKNYLLSVCKSHNLPFIDILSPCLNQFKEFLDSTPVNQPGIIRKLDEDYFKRVEAVEFAVKYDDGKDPRGILKADIVLIGVSRSSKTPLSMYLAHKNYKVVNIPLVKGAKVPAEIYQVKRKKVVGLMIDPLELAEIRRERIRVLGLDNSVDYVQVEKIMEEIDYADKVMKKVGCPRIDMTRKAVEEAANIIIDLTHNGLH